jgi:hypothetical protein
VMMQDDDIDQDDEIRKAKAQLASMKGKGVTKTDEFKAPKIPAVKGAKGSGGHGGGHMKVAAKRGPSAHAQKAPAFKPVAKQRAAMPGAVSKPAPRHMPKNAVKKRSG